MLRELPEEVPVDGRAGSRRIDRDPRGVGRFARRRDETKGGRNSGRAHISQHGFPRSLKAEGSTPGGVETANRRAGKAFSLWQWGFTKRIGEYQKPYRKPRFA
jgi:hypothetical protein